MREVGATERGTHMAELGVPIAKRSVNELLLWLEREHDNVRVLESRLEAVELGTGRRSDVVRTVRIPDIDEMSRPKRPPPMHAKDPTRYWKLL
jgi:hypothetical protein